MTGDGTQVLYLSMRDGVPQAAIANTDGSSGDRQLTGDPSGIQSAILSGDGSTAYATTLGGRLLRISIEEGAVQELIPRTPLLDSTAALASSLNGNEVAPCEIVPLTGVGLSDGVIDGGQQLPESLGGVQVFVQGKPARIQRVAPTAITVLIPPNLDFSLGVNAEVRLVTDSPSPFESDPNPRVVRSVEFSPWLLWVYLDFGFPELLAIHEDWSGTVTADNPARPGEVLHAYGSGLGPTTPALPCGQTAPATEAIPLSVPFQCVLAHGTPVEVTFQGLAPGTAGYYQFDFRVPAEMAEDRFEMFCQIKPGVSSLIGGIVPVMRVP